MTIVRAVAPALAVALLLGCSETTTAPALDADPADTGALAADTGAADTGATPRDTGAPALDAAADDTGADDAGAPADVAPEDTGGAPLDTGGAPADVAPVPDARPTDARQADAPTTPREPPPPRAYSNGTCPRLVGGPTAATSQNNDFRSGRDRRSFRLLVPRRYDPSRPTPVMFAWHWLNASSGSFIRDGELETAIEEMGMIVVLPERKSNDRGDRAYLFDWPFVETWGAPAELAFFDDMLACVSAQYNVDRRRVYAVGVSAGALWVTYLSSTDRANHLAAIESLSGGLGEQALVWRMEYTPQPHKFPALVLWGGPSDWLGLSFHDASRRFRDALVRDDHFVVQCTHDRGHALPPVERPAGGGTRFRALWQFFLDHPYGLAPGASPYLTAGLPAAMPSWCSIARR